MINPLDQIDAAGDMFDSLRRHNPAAWNVAVHAFSAFCYASSMQQLGEMRTAGLATDEEFTKNAQLFFTTYLSCITLIDPAGVAALDSPVQFFTSLRKHATNRGSSE